MHVRIKNDKARIWTTLPASTSGATELTDEQVQALTASINALPKDKFGRHQAQLSKGATVKAQGKGMIADAIKAVLSGTPTSKKAQKAQKKSPQKKATSPRKQATPKQIAALEKARAAKAQKRDALVQADFEAELVLVDE